MVKAQLVCLCHGKKASINMSELLETLEAFKEKVNTNENVRKLIKNWNPNVTVSSDTENFTMIIRDQVMEQVATEKLESDHTIEIEADEDTLIDVFNGTYNPSKAVLDGELAVFGQDQDQMKLDIIAVFLWET